MLNESSVRWITTRTTSTPGLYDVKIMSKGTNPDYPTGYVSDRHLVSDRFKVLNGTLRHKVSSPRKKKSRIPIHAALWNVS